MTNKHAQIVGTECRRCRDEFQFLRRKHGGSHHARRTRDEHDHADHDHAPRRRTNDGYQRNGKDKQRDRLQRIDEALRHQVNLPPKKPEAPPITLPSIVPPIDAPSPIVKESRVPAMQRLSTSRPSSSVPNQYLLEVVQALAG